MGVFECRCAGAQHQRSAPHLDEALERLARFVKRVDQLAEAAPHLNASRHRAQRFNGAMPSAALLPGAAVAPTPAAMPAD